MTREHDLDLDPELEAAARRQLHRLAAAIAVDDDSVDDAETVDVAAVDADLDVGPDQIHVATVITPNGEVDDDAPRHGPGRVVLLAAAVLVVITLGAVAVLVVAGDDDRSGDIAADDPEGSAPTDALFPPDDESTSTEVPQWLEGPWLTDNDQPMPTDGRGPTLNFSSGPADCGEGRLTFVALTLPPGFMPYVENPNRRFVRDADHELDDSSSVRGEFDGDTTMPDDAQASGLHNDDAELWMSQANPDALYVRRSDGTVERWPRVDWESAVDCR